MSDNGKKKAPDDIAALQKEAEAAIRAGDRKRAAELLIRVIDQGPDNAYAFFQLGKVLYGAGNKEEAKNRLLTAVEMAPDMAGARFLLGRIFIDEKQYRGAMLHLREVVRLDPDDHEAFFYLAQACIHSDLTDDALTLLLKAHSIEPEEPLYIESLGVIYSQKKEYAEAYKYLSHEKLKNTGRVETVNMLAKSAGEIGNRFAQMKAFELSLQLNPNQPDIEEMLGKLRKELGSVHTVEHSSKKKIAFFSRIDSFLGDIMSHFQREFEVKKFSGETLDDMTELLAWCDLAWFEWCDELLVMASKLPKTATIICRLHRYEAFSPYPQKVNWRNVDHLICVFQPIVDVLRSQIDIQTPVSVIQNGVDFGKYPLPENKNYGKKIAYVGYLKKPKAPDLLIQCFAKIHNYDPEYSLHIAGEIQDLEIQVYIEHILKKMNLPVTFCGWVDPVAPWLEDKDFIISSSISESFQFAIVEGIARGLLPFVHNWPGSEEIYPSECIFNTVDECLEILKRYEQSDKHVLVKSYRDILVGRFAVEKQMHLIDNLVKKYINGVNNGRE
ncbi:tetratricopeptide repeat protein [candidate division KSB1 bacterium]